MIIATDRWKAQVLSVCGRTVCRPPGVVSLPPDVEMTLIGQGMAVYYEPESPETSLESIIDSDDDTGIKLDGDMEGLMDSNSGLIVEPGIDRGLEEPNETTEATELTAAETIEPVEPITIKTKKGAKK
jgi:hypothetical protein